MYVCGLSHRSSVIDLYVGFHDDLSRSTETDSSSVSMDTLQLQWKRLWEEHPRNKVKNPNTCSQQKTTDFFPVKGVFYFF